MKTTNAVCSFAPSSGEEKSVGELYIHYTPENLDTKTQSVIEMLKSSPMFPTTADEMAAVANELAGCSYEEYSAVYPEFSDEYQLDSIFDENGYKILKLRYKGKRDNNLPEADVIYIHGGGFLFKMGEMHRDICQRLARQMNFTVYIPLFPCAPNYYVRTTLDMLLGLYKKVTADGKTVYLMGDSAGGNIALAFGLHLKNLGEKLPDAILGISPLCDLRQNSPELIEVNKKDILMTMVLMHEVSTHWRPEDMSYEDPLVSPLYGDWTGMPQTFLFTGTDESLYPEIKQIAQKMRDSGMRVGMLVGNGLFHIAPLMQIPVQDQYFDEITEFLYGAGKSKVIDLENHLYLPEFIDYMRTRTDYPLYRDGLGFYTAEKSSTPIHMSLGHFTRVPADDAIPMTKAMGDLEDGRIAAMDNAEVTIAALSTSVGVEMLPREDAVKYARMTNDAVAAAIRQYPGRFVGTICLPMPYVEESVAELERAVNELGLSYWHTHANYGPRHLNEPEFDPMLAKCAELGVAFYLHPANPSDPYLTDGGMAMSSAGWGFGVETMKVAIQIIINGTFDRYPDLCMILGHMGEYFPYTLDRMNNRFSIYRGIDPEYKCKENFTYYFEHKNIMVTTSGIYDPAVIECGIKTIGIDNIMLGSDYPYENIKASVDFIKNLPVSNEYKDKILYKNAEKYILNK